MFRKRLAFCASASAVSYLVISAPHRARLAEEKRAYEIERPGLPPKQSSIIRPASPIYTPLAKANSQIRLLSIIHDSQSAGVHCNLDVVSLDDKPAYCALSYTWGDPIKRSSQLPSILSRVLSFIRGLYRRLFNLDRIKGPNLVFVNDKPFPVTENLYLALEQLRSEEHELPIWIDQICINQEDPEEKASQIGLMASIYQGAQQTLIWLGPSADDSDAAMDYMTPGKRPDDAPVPSSALRALFARSWWERIWIVQEVFLSREPIVKCGTRSLPLRSVKPPESQTDNLTPRSHSFRGVLGLWDTRRRIEEDHGLMWLTDMILSFVFADEPIDTVYQKRQMPVMDLWQWVYQTHQFQSTMPRDRIFALLNIARREDRDAIRVLYPESDADVAAIAQGECDVFTQATSWMIRNGRCLDVLQLSRPESKTLAGLPSWVPDFSAPQNSGLDTLVTNYRADGGPEAWATLTPKDVREEKYYEYSPIQSADWARRQLLWILPYQLALLRWPRAQTKWLKIAVAIHLVWLTKTLAHSDIIYGWKPRLEFGDISTISDDGRRISLQGVVVDRIDVVDPAPNLGVVNPGEPVLHSLEHYRRRLTGHLRKWEKLSVAHAGNPYGDNPTAKRQAFWRVVAMNGLRKTSRLRLTYPSARVDEGNELEWEKCFKAFAGPSSLSFLSRRLEKDEMARLIEYGTAVVGAINERALMLTGGGLIGFGPQPAQRGDLLCLLRGGRVPFLLRPNEDGTHRYVGDCYVQGLMGGEFFSRSKLGPEAVQTFQLC